jgi:AcrR family transcriptional regulator
MTYPSENRGGSELALIHAAERLFAEHGIAGVSLRQVNQAANQKNISAAHYHFGSREGLVVAVLNHRWERLDRRRAELLRRPDRPKDLRFYLEAFIAPLIEELAPRQEGNYYLRFIQQYERYRSDYELAKRLSPAGVEIYARIEDAIFYLPVPIRNLRMAYLINMIHSVLATAEERMCKGELDHRNILLIASNLMDMIVSALTAPISIETINLLASNERAAGM